MLEGCAFQSVADSRDPASEEGSTSSAGRKVVVRILMVHRKDHSVQYSETVEKFRITERYSH